MSYEACKGADQSTLAKVSPAIPELFDWPRWSGLSVGLHIVCCPMAIQASGLKKRKVVVDIHENQRTLFITRQEGELYSRQRKSSSLTKTAYKLPRLRHTDWSCCEFWIRQCFPPFMSDHNQKLLIFTTVARKQLRCWQKCCFRVSSNCSLRPLPYSEDCILKKGRRGGRKQ